MTAPTAPTVEAPVTLADIDVHALTMWLRSLGANWTPQHVEAALHRISRSTDGDLFKTVAYLEHMAAHNVFLWRWLSKMLSDELLAIDVNRQVGTHPAVAWQDMPGRYLAGDDLTFDDLIRSALSAESAYERILTTNRAQDVGLNYKHVVCARCDVCLTFQAFTLIHLSRTEPKPHDPYDGETDSVVFAAHRLGDVRPATVDDIKHYELRARRARGSGATL